MNMKDQTPENDRVLKISHQISEMIEAQKEAQSGEEEQIKSVYKFHELWQNRDVKQEFLINDLIPKDNLIVLIGEDGIGKTMLMIQLCFSVCMNDESFFNIPLNTKHQKAIFVATEDSHKKFISASRKIKDYLYPDFEVKEGSPEFNFIEASNYESLQQVIDTIKDDLKNAPADLVVIDTLTDLISQLLDGDTNSAKDANKALHPLQILADEYKTTIIVLHHVSKSAIEYKRKQNLMFVEKNDQMGSSRITGKPRTILALTHDRNSRTNGSVFNNYLHLVKTNSTKDTYLVNALKLEFSNDSLTHDFVELTNIQDHEERKEELTSNAPKQKYLPDELSDAVHEERIKIIFGKDVLLTKKEFLTRFTQVYNVNQNQFNRSGGFGNYLKEKNFIKLELNHYKKGDKFNNNYTKQVPF